MSRPGDGSASMDATAGASSTSAAAVSPGARVLLFGKHRATVRYVGLVEGQSGQWVGVEYDDPSAGGKHDGSHAGRCYFSTHHPTAGSLVRLQKFVEAAHLGVSLAAAAAERYGEGSTSSGSGGDCGSGGDGIQQQAEAGSGSGRQQHQQRQQVHSEQLYLSTGGNRRVAVELLALQGGAAAAARRQSGTGGGGFSASLIGMAVSSVGDAEQLRATLPTLTELDLSDNLVASWTFVAELAAALPALHTLNLSGNRLALPGLASAAHAQGSEEESGSGGGSAIPASLARPPSASLAGLQCLVLNGCGVRWEQAVAVALQLPSLRELHLCGNGIASLALPSAAGVAQSVPGSSSSSAGSTGAEALLVSAFGRLELLDLDSNQLSSWADVAPLGALPALRTLLMSGNRLTAVECTGGFASLRSLLLGSNQLASWAAVDQLDRFPALEEARLSENPVTAAAPSVARYQCIARVSRLTMLNASSVSPAERWDAEVNYLRQVTDELAAAGADEAARSLVLAANPRFAALTQRYGELTPAAPKASAGSSLASSMAQLTIAHNGKELQKKLPVSLTVGKLKLMLERLLRVKAGQQALLLVPPIESGSQPEDVTDEDTRELRYFDVCDGCRLELSLSDPAARAAALAAAKAAAATAHAQRMVEHEQAIQQFRAVEQRLMT